jgi:K+-transporting ATPase A subunit
MTTNGYLQIGVYLIVLVALTKPLGWYMARIYEGQSVWLDRFGSSRIEASTGSVALKKMKRWDGKPME